MSDFDAGSFDEVEVLEKVRDFSGSYEELQKELENLIGEAGKVQAEQSRKLKHFKVVSGKAVLTEAGWAKLGPLSDAEKEALVNLEEEAESSMLQTGRALQKIRRKGLYREYGTIAEYARKRFGRTKDWFMKLVRLAEVTDKIPGGAKITTRDSDQLNKLKAQPEKMAQALSDADEASQKEGRERTPDDVKKAVERQLPKKHGRTPLSSPKPSSQKKVKWEVSVEHSQFKVSGTTTDLPEYFRTTFADKLAKVEAEITRSFTVKVKRAK